MRLRHQENDRYGKRPRYEPLVTMEDGLRFLIFFRRNPLQPCFEGLRVSPYLETFVFRKQLELFGLALFAKFDLDPFGQLVEYRDDIVDFLTFSSFESVRQILQAILGAGFDALKNGVAM